MCVVCQSLSEVFANGKGWSAVGLSPDTDFGSDNGPLFILNARGAGPIGGKTSKTITDAGAQISRSNTTWNGGVGTLGQAATITYAFCATAPTTMPDGSTGFSQFDATQIAVSELALQSWSDVAQLTFTRVGSGTSGPGAFSDAATMLFGNYSAGAAGAAAFAYGPGDRADAAVDGDLWFNNTLSYNATPVNLEYGFQVFTHEIGHAIGLDHPGAYNAGPSGELTHAANAEYYEDTRQYSLMSYFDAPATGGNHLGQFAAAPLLDDIAAIQRLYGANMTTRTGDSVYGFNSNTGRIWYTATSATTPVIFAVWDAGGIDTLDFSGYTQAGQIDLRQGAFSSVGGMTYNVAIAQGVTIENAVGGVGDDTLTGNDANNRLTGGAGLDTMIGGLGNDRYDVDNIGDVVTELAGGGTADVIVSSVSYTIAANFEQMRIDGTGLTGTGSANGDLLVTRTAGNTLVGLGGDDVYVVGAAGTTVTEAAGGGSDVVVAEVDFTLPGEIELLIVRGTGLTGTGNGGNNTFLGQTGTNSFVGLGGDDTYVLGSAGDTVTEAAAGGSDTVFSSFTHTLASEVETLFLRGTALSGTGNGLNNLLVSEVGANTLIGLAGDDTYVVNSTADVVTEAAGEGFDQVVARVSYTLTANVEQLVLVGAGLTGTGTGASDVLVNLGIGNTLQGLGGDDFYIVATPTVIVEAAGVAGGGRRSSRDQTGRCGLSAFSS